MSLFTSKARIAVHQDDTLPAGDPAQNTVYIKSKMNFRDTSTYKDFLVRGHVVGEAMQMETRIGTAELELLRINVLGWAGPGFVNEHGQPIPYSPAAIDDVDSDDPFWQKVLGEINVRNKRPDDDSKKRISDGGDNSTATAQPAMLGELVTSSSPSLNGTTGRRIKSVN